MPNTPQSELTAILQGAAIAPITDRAFLRITGEDPHPLAQRYGHQFHADA